MRLDNFLLKKGYVQSRTKAQEIIKESLVSVDGTVVSKSSYKLVGDEKIDIAQYKRFVSRSAHKLDKFLDEIDIDLDGMIGLDIGSSTGGFTQVLLQKGVKEVSAVDVGKGQLDKSLKDDKRVLSYESCDIRDFRVEKCFDIVTSDVAFISLHYILDDIDRLASKHIILLFKPQFEVGRGVKRDKNGVVLDKKSIQKAMIKFEDACGLKGWSLIKKSPSQLAGKGGNIEYCYYYKK